MNVKIGACVGVLFVMMLAAGCGSSPAKPQVTSVHCDPQPDGSVHIYGTVRNNGKAGVIDINPYVKLLGGEHKTQYLPGEQTVPSGQSIPFVATIPLPPDAQPVGCWAYASPGTP